MLSNMARRTSGVMCGEALDGSSRRCHMSLTWERPGIWHSLMPARASISAHMSGNANLRGSMMSLVVSFSNTDAPWFLTVGRTIPPLS